MGQLKVIVGGQAGSEAKGACTAYLARRAKAEGKTVTVIRVAGPNAGHTAYDDEGRKWALRTIPVAAVTNLDAMLVIAAGSEVDFEVLYDETERLEAAGIPIRSRLLIDRQATVLTATHRLSESEGNIVGRIGSTGKGVGAARADRIARTAEIVADRRDELEGRGYLVADSGSDLYAAVTDPEGCVLIEGTQGYVLGLHAGYYPQCTSSDCRAIDFLAMAGIDPHWTSREDYEVWVVMRTYPIRVAGNSGPLDGETTWEDLGFEPERTTVTQKIRRVGQWNGSWAADAVVANGGPDVVRISLSMADYVVPEAFNQTEVDPASTAADDLAALIGQVERSAGARVHLVGTGPQTFIEVPE